MDATDDAALHVDATPDATQSVAFEDDVSDDDLEVMTILAKAVRARINAEATKLRC